MSPVIGVILMVAITVILAAVIAAFVMDIGNSVGTSAPPTGNIEFDYNADKNMVNATVQSVQGGGLQASRLNVTGDLSTSAPAGSGVLWQDQRSVGCSSGCPYSAEEELTAGDDFTIAVADAGYEISVVWNDGSTSSTLAEHSGPDA